jgi:hypothetical protein
MVGPLQVAGPAACWPYQLYYNVPAPRIMDLVLMRPSQQFPLPLGKGFRAPYFYCLVKVTFSLQGQTKLRHTKCVMVHKHSNRELFEQHLNSRLGPFIIYCLPVCPMVFSSMYRLLVSKSVAMNLSFLFRSSTLPHTAVSCHRYATFHSRHNGNPQNVVSEIA